MILRSPAVFSALADDPLISALAGLLESENAAEAYAFSARVAGILYKEGCDLTQSVLTRVLRDDNAYLRAAASGKPPDTLLEACFRRELSALYDAAVTDSEKLARRQGLENLMPGWRTSELDFGAAYDKMLLRLPLDGFGIYAVHHMFYLASSGEPVPVSYPDPLKLSQLYGYERQRDKILKNTEALLSGAPANNLLLYGDAGTGKSSTVKALTNELKGRGLRLIQVEKENYAAIPRLLENLAPLPLKFIVFLDDVSFSEGDAEFAILKTVLEGSVCATPKNVVVYATSNRRHLVKESFAARAGDDVHREDTLEETASLSARFGLIINFGRPGHDDFGDILMSLAAEYGVEEDEKTLLREAEAFAIRLGGRSPRAARQYIEYRLTLKKSDG